MNAHIYNTQRTLAVGLLIASLFGAVGCGGDGSGEGSDEEQEKTDNGCGSTGSGWEGVFGNLDFKPSADVETDFYGGPLGISAGEPLPMVTDSYLTFSVSDANESAAAVGGTSLEVESSDESVLRVLEVTDSTVRLHAIDQGRATLSAQYGDLADERVFEVMPPARWKVELVTKQFSGFSLAESEELCEPADGTAGNPPLARVGTSIRFRHYAEFGARRLFGLRENPVQVRSESNDTPVSLSVHPDDEGIYQFRVPAEWANERVFVESPEQKADGRFYVAAVDQVYSWEFTSLSLGFPDLVCSSSSGTLETVCRWSDGRFVEPFVLQLIPSNSDRCFLLSDACDVRMDIVRSSGSHQQLPLNVASEDCFDERTVDCMGAGCSLAVSQVVSLDLDRRDVEEIRLTYAGQTKTIKFSDER